MIALLIATTNPNKIKEINELLRNEKIKIKSFSLPDLSINTSFIETQNTFREIASSKAIFYSRQAKDILTVAEDSGLAVEALNGEPGIKSARYSGKHSNDKKNIAKLLKEMENSANRKAYFISVIAIASNGRLLKLFTGRVSGQILKRERGFNGFGYDPVFFYPPLKKTFAELKRKEKNSVSHRAISVKKMQRYILTLKNSIPGIKICR